MTEFILWVLLVAAWCWGVNNAFAEGEIFGKIGDYARNKLPKWVVKPTIGCPKCMPSVQGTIWYFMCINEGLLHWILFIVCVSGLNTVIINFINEEEND